MQTIRQRLHALLLLAALTISLSVPASAAGSLPFTDVDPSEWYYTYVQDPVSYTHLDVYKRQSQLFRQAIR